MRRPFEEVQQSINNDLDQLSIIGIVLVSAFSVAFFGSCMQGKLDFGLVRTLQGFFSVCFAVYFAAMPTFSSGGYILFVGRFVGC